METTQVVSIELQPKKTTNSTTTTPPSTPLAPLAPLSTNGGQPSSASPPRPSSPITNSDLTTNGITIADTNETTTRATTTPPVTPASVVAKVISTATPTPPTTPPLTSATSIITINHKNPERISTATTPTPTPPPLSTTTTGENIESAVILPASAMPSTSRQLFHEAAAEHGGNEATNFIQAEIGAHQLPQAPPSRVRTASSTLDATVSRYPSTSGKHEKKIGHRRVDEGGEVTYKRIQSKQIMGSIQLGIQHTVGSLASKPKRDLLMNDFWEVETISFPAEGSSITPAHHYNDFRFKVYAPIAFRYFRDLFGIAPDDFLMSMCAAPLLQLSNPGASGSIFYLTNDDEFIIKTVQKKECEFLQKLLPGYYMNLSQNPRTLLPKFFGLYCFHYNAKNVRLVAMNNLLPSDIKMHSKYDLKGSTFRRKASKAERQKASPTFKDLDFMEHHPNGIFLETDKYNALMKTIQRDCMVLESFQIMDYSLLVGIHNLDIAQKEKREERIRNARAKLLRTDEAQPQQQQQQREIGGGTNANFIIGDGSDLTDAVEQNAQIAIYNPNQPVTAKLSTASTASTTMGGGGGVGGGGGGGATALNRTRSMNRPRLVAHSTAIESITADMDMPIEEDEDVPAGGIPARSENDERLILYIGIIDILQSYRLEKKLEHTFKSIIYNGDTVSVCRPSFYAQRFQNFMGKTVFKKTPTFPLKHSPSKRKTSNVMLRSTPLRNFNQNQNPNAVIATAGQLRSNFLSGSSTPPPAFDDISEEDITATSSTAGIGAMRSEAGSSYNYGNHRPATRHWAPQRSVVSNSNRSFVGSSSNATDDYGETTDDEIYSTHSGGGGGGASRSGGARSPSSHTSHTAHTRSPRLSKTNVQLTTIGCLEDGIEKPDNRIVVAVKSLADSADESDMAQVVDNLNNHHNGEHHQSQILSTAKTTVVKAVQSQTYTSTLVLNDVIR